MSTTQHFAYIANALRIAFDEGKTAQDRFAALAALRNNGFDPTTPAAVEEFAAFSRQCANTPHTSGPWTASAGRDIYWRGMVLDKRKQVLAYVKSEPERITADTRLIAAAPDLLNVARWSRDVMRQAFDEVLQTIPEGGPVPPWMATLETTIADAEIAIARATGEAQS